MTRPWSIVAVSVVLFALGALAGSWVTSKGYQVTVAELKADHAGVLQGHAEQLRDLAEKTTAAAEAARAAENSQRVALAAVEHQHQQDMENAQASADQTHAALRDGSLRLREEWQCPAARPYPGTGVPSSPALAGSLDAGTDLRFASASDLIRLADEADATVRGLQSAAEVSCLVPMPAVLRLPAQ